MTVAGQEKAASMKYDAEKHHRRSIRLKGYDYGSVGAYFVTICTQNRACWFGAVADGEMQLNEVGRIAQVSWHELPARFPNISLEVSVVMPNHIHGIIIVGAQFIAPQDRILNLIASTSQGAMNRAPTLGEIVRSYKAVSSRVIRRSTTPDFAWQRNYYEHVIRGDDSLNRIRQYVLDNPSHWVFDRENPAATSLEPANLWHT